MNEFLDNDGGLEPDELSDVMDLCGIIEGEKKECIEAVDQRADDYVDIDYLFEDEPDDRCEQCDDEAEDGYDDTGYEDEDD